MRLHWQMSSVYIGYVLFILVKWRSVYSVHKILGLCVSAGTLVRNYDATNMAPTQTDNHLSSKRTSHFQTHKRSWKEHKLGHASWRGPKPSTPLLARTSSNLLDWTGFKILTAVTMKSTVFWEVMLIILVVFTVTPYSHPSRSQCS
jgi:hypothetical protein